MAELLVDTLWWHILLYYIDWFGLFVLRLYYGKIERKYYTQLASRNKVQRDTAEVTGSLRHKFANFGGMYLAWVLVDTVLFIVHLVLAAIVALFFHS